jgi:hypothetical protein
MKFSLAIFLLCGSLSAYAALNKWVDADGKVHYSDTAPSDVKVKKIKSSSSPDSISPASGASAPKSLAERDAEWKKSQKAKAEAEQKAAKKTEEDNVKQKNCALARSNLSTLESSQSIVTYNDKGERTFMDDASRTQQLEEARKSVSSFCN